MGCKAVLLAVVCASGCGTVPLYEQPYEGLDEVEKAKLATRNWQACRDGVNQWEDAVRAEGQDEAAFLRHRISLIEQALPYGRRAYEIYPTTAEDATRWLAWATSYLGWDYTLLGKLLEQRAAGPDGDPRLARDANEALARGAGHLRDGARLLLHYRRVYFDRSRDLMLFHVLGINYELLGDFRSAYLVTMEWLKHLEALQIRSDVPQVKEGIARCKIILEKLRQKMRDHLQEVPVMDTRR